MGRLESRLRSLLFLGVPSSQQWREIHSDENGNRNREKGVRAYKLFSMYRKSNSRQSDFNPDHFLGAKWLFGEEGGEK